MLNNPVFPKNTTFGVVFLELSKYVVVHWTQPTRFLYSKLFPLLLVGDAIFWYRYFSHRGLIKALRQNVQVFSNVFQKQPETSQCNPQALRECMNPNNYIQGEIFSRQSWTNKRRKKRVAKSKQTNKISWNQFIWVSY